MKVKLFTLAILLMSSIQAFCQVYEAINNKAMELMNNDQYTEAISLLNPLVEKNPSVTVYRYNRAVTYFNLKKYQEAIADYKILLEELPEAEYAFQIGNAYEQMDSTLKAVSYFTKAISMDKDNYLYYFKRGTVHLKKSKFVNAIQDFNQSLLLNPEHDNSMHNRGIALFYTKKYEQACEDWCNASRLGNPHSTEHVKKNCKSVLISCDN